MKILGAVMLVILILISPRSLASANTFIQETERLIALSDKTYTVVVNQYQQTYSYWTGISRLLVRVIDIDSNQLISEVVLSSVQVDRAMDEPFDHTYRVLDEPQSFGGLLVKPQSLYNNLEYPKYRFQLDDKGAYLNKNGRQNLLEYKSLDSRFSNVGSNVDNQLDTNSGSKLRDALGSSDFEFTGWYKPVYQGRQYYFLVLKIGRFDDDTGGLEYVFSVPGAE